MVNYKFFNNDSMFREQAEACITFFKNLTEALGDEYEMVNSGSKEFIIMHKHAFGDRFRLSDKYLVPFGTKSKITYYTKPYWSFRLSDHWNWYESTKLCKQKNFIQCFDVDLPVCFQRTVPEDQRSNSCNAIQVAIFGNRKDEAYHCVYGTYKDKETHEWKWMEKTPQEVIDEWNLA